MTPPFKPYLLRLGTHRTTNTDPTYTYTSTRMAELKQYIGIIYTESSQYLKYQRYLNTQQKIQKILTSHKLVYLTSFLTKTEKGGYCIV
jgi:hypothetical protein